MVGIRQFLYVGYWRMMQVEDDEFHTLRHPVELSGDPSSLVALGQQRRIAIQVQNLDFRAQPRGIPAVAAQCGEGIPPVLQALRFVRPIELMVSQRRKYADAGF